MHLCVHVCLHVCGNGRVCASVFGVHKIYYELFDFMSQSFKSLLTLDCIYLIGLQI